MALNRSVARQYLKVQFMLLPDSQPTIFTLTIGLGAW